MIYTFTFNPAIDYVVSADKISFGEVNRLCGEEIFFGGKGINVSYVLSQLGVKSKALGFVAGFTGEYIEKSVKDAGIETDFVHLDRGFSRINVKIKSESETDLNGQGPHIPDDKLEELFKKLHGIKDGDTVVLAGSVPKTLPPDIYERILGALSDRNVRAVVDATGKLLLNVLKYKPYLIKPNNFELEEIFGLKLSGKSDIIDCARKLKKMGAENVLVSMAQDGAILLDENGDVHECRACTGEVKNSVGAGDSMVAGFLAGIEKGDYQYALKLGTAAGGATAFSQGLADYNEISRLLSQII